MKKNTKKIIAVLGISCLAIIFICMISIGKNTSSSPEIQVYAKPLEQILENQAIPAPTDREEAFYENQAESVDNYNEMLEAFEGSGSGLSAFNEGQSSEEKEYPDYYGGAYIDEETGGLVVLVKEAVVDLKSAKTEIAALTNETTVISNKSVENGIRVEACEVSRNEIDEVIDFLSDQIDGLRNQGVEITMIRDDIRNGKVIVSILNLTEEKEELVRSLLDCSFLQFEEGDYAEEEEAIGGGTEIINMTDWLGGTIGFAAKRTGRYGFVVSGHIGNTIGDEFLYNGIVIGSVGRTAYYNGSTADAAFLVASPGITVTNVINQSAVTGGYAGELPQGTLIYMQGGPSGRQAGKIVNYNVTSVAENGKEFRKQATASYSSQGGDSGAPILFYSSGKYFICGIHRSNNTKDNYKVFSTFSNIVDELGISFVASTVRVSGYK